MGYAVLQASYSLDNKSDVHLESKLRTCPAIPLLSYMLYEMAINYAETQFYKHSYPKIRQTIHNTSLNSAVISKVLPATREKIDILRLIK
jgi:hypothetical protein